MKNIILLALILLTVPNISACQDSSDEQSLIRVISLSKTKFDWLINKNYDSLNALLDDKVEYIHSSGWVQSKKDVIDDFKSGKLSYSKINVKETHAILYGPTAIVEGLATFDGINTGKGFSFELRYSEVYVRKGKRWLLVLRHANRMP